MSDNRIEDYTKEEIEEYIDRIIKLIDIGKYTISRNSHNRSENDNFIKRFNINTKKEKEILTSLNVYDYCYSTRNTNKGWEHEILYVFKKRLVTTTFDGKKEVDMYIKTNIMEGKAGEHLIVISFHEMNYPMETLFKED